LLLVAQRSDTACRGREGPSGCGPGRSSVLLPKPRSLSSLPLAVSEPRLPALRFPRPRDVLPFDWSAAGRVDGARDGGSSAWSTQRIAAGVEGESSSSGITGGRPSGRRKRAPLRARFGKPPAPPDSASRIVVLALLGAARAARLAVRGRPRGVACASRGCFGPTRSVALWPRPSTDAQRAASAGGGRAPSSPTLPDASGRRRGSRLGAYSLARAGRPRSEGEGVRFRRPKSVGRPPMIHRRSRSPRTFAR